MTAGLLGAARVHAVTDYAELSKRIQAAGLLKRRYGYYWCRIVGLVSAFAGVWVTFAFLGNSWFQLIVAAVLAAVVTQFGFLGHDGAHRQILAWPTRRNSSPPTSNRAARRPRSRPTSRR